MLTKGKRAMTENTGKSLIPLDENKALKAFKSPDGLEPLLNAIEIECRAAPVVLNTENGRKNIASLAYKVAQAKNRIDEIGKSLTEDSRRFIETINESRRGAWNRLEALQKEIRGPLDEWEQKEKSRIATIEAALADIQNLAIFPPEAPPLSSAEIKSRIHALNNIDSLNAADGTAWAEYETRAKRYRAESLDTLQAALKVAEAREQDERETAEWHALYAKAEQENREFDIARAAAKAAREAAEERARIAAEAAAAQAAIDLIWSEAHRENAEFDERKAVARAEAEESAKWQAIYAAADAENEAFDTRKNAERLAKEEADRAAEKAAQDERDRQKREADEKAAADAKRAADEAHSQKIDGEAIDALTDLLEGLGDAVGDNSQDWAFEIVNAIKKGEIPHVAIKY